MLHIVLTILKIVGIVLAVILGLVVLLICVVLLTPLRYQIEASATGDIDSIQAKVKFSWLLHFISGYINYEEKKADWQVKILWKKIDFEKWGKKAASEVTEELLDEEELWNKEESLKGESLKGESLKEENVSQERKSEESSRTKKNRAKKSKKGTKRKKKRGVFQRIKYTIQNICDKIKALLQKKEELEQFIKNEIHKSAFVRVKTEVFRLLRFLKPKKIQMNLHFGFEDPSLTGKTLGAISMLYPFFAKHINVTPDFQNSVLEGDIYIKGKIKAVYMLIMIWNLLFDKNIRTTYKHMKSGKANK